MTAVRRLVRLGMPLLALGGAVALVLGSTQCGLLSSPGDYTSGSATTDGADGSVEGGSLSDAPSAPNDATVLPDGFVVPQSIGTIAVMAGQRDPTTPDDNPAFSADAWSAILDANGDVATWRVDSSAPIIGGFDSAIVMGNLWVMVNNGFGVGGTYGSAVQTTTWGPGIAGGWKAASAKGAPGGLDEAAHAFYGTHFFYIGGTRTNAGVDGGPPTTFFTRETHVSAVDKAVPDLGVAGDTGPLLVNARSRTTALFENGALYVVGGRSSMGLTNSVEMAKVDLVSGALQAFSEQPALMNNGQPYRVSSPGVVAANGYLFVAGGRSIPMGAPTDVVLSAKINADGTLGAFQSCTGLQRALYNFAFVAFKGRLYVMGGVSTTSRTDEVWSASIAGDGTLSAWKASAKLPSPRSDFVALGY